MGPTFLGFLENVAPAGARDDVKSSAISVLSRALQAGPGRTGLVVGRVQSGKTLSYESVISLARDNGFSLIVVISGISNPLLAQGVNRLHRDLELAEEDGWEFLEPAADNQPADAIANSLAARRDNWLEPDFPSRYKKTAVVFLLKHYSRIADFAEICEQLQLNSMKTLIIDDEADQASLNTQGGKNKQSPTYKALLELRESLASHYYLQYTATPQAPLLVAIQDALSPDFVSVLEPGAGYVGGDAYFATSNSLVRTIPDSELNAADAPGGPPPTSLRSAILEFLVGAANTVAADDPNIRSMLIHPSRETYPHATFKLWVDRMISHWTDSYSHASEAEPIKMRNEFLATWRDLEGTFPEIEPFEACWKALNIVFKNLSVVEMNAVNGKTPVIKWDKTKAYILIGGQAMDRGFTVEGLTVTYMPRGPGSWTADTLQQRARFFGYKAAYLGLCRVYLDPDALVAFNKYVAHEKEMISSLKEIDAGARSLKEWKRQFLLDKKFKATRQSVVGIPVLRITQSDKWIIDRFPLRSDASLSADINDGISSLISDDEWVHDQFNHLRTRVSVARALHILELVEPASALLERNFQALSVQLAIVADNDPDAKVAVIRIRPGQDTYRTLRSDGGVQIFQGRSPRGDSYPGDRQIFDEDAVLTMQIHHVRLLEGDTKASLGDVVTLAVRVNDAVQDWVVEVGSD
jgi:hypothetical protein